MTKEPTLHQIKDFMFDLGIRDSRAPKRVFAYYNAMGWDDGTTWQSKCKYFAKKYYKL